jgi:competence protein ComEA
MRFMSLVIGVLLLAGAGVLDAQTSGQKNKATTASVATKPIDLNTATAAQLETLPGIGPATAQRIVEYREKNGGFKKIEELMNVRGIGEKSFLKIKDLITVTPPRTKAGSGGLADR